MLQSPDISVKVHINNELCPFMQEGKCKGNPIVDRSVQVRTDLGSMQSVPNYTAW